MHSLDQFQKRRDTVLQDAANKLPAGDRDALLSQAILQRYSSDRPRTIVTDIVGSGIADEPLPTAENATWEDGYSGVISLEWPVGSVPANYLLDEDWQYYRTPSAILIRFLAAVPNAGDAIRVTWTARHCDDGSTVPDQDFEAVCDFSAALCFEALAAIYTQTSDPSLIADAVNYRTKGQEYLAMAKAIRQRYFDHIGVEDDSKDASIPAAIAITSIHENLAGTDYDRLTHPRVSR